LVAQGLTPLLGPNTIVLPAMNGVPWWFCEGIEAVGPGPLRSVDPQGEIGRCVAPQRVVGCVVHASAFTPEPGVVTHVHGRNLVIGEPAGGSSDRVQRLNELLSHAGFDVTVSGDVRLAIWFKLLGNMTMNPVSALTGATMDRMLADPLVRNFCSAVMLEAADIGERIGCKVEATPEDRHAVTAKLGAVKTSMLQDAEAGRPLELDAIVSAVHEIGQRLGRSTPHLDALLGLTRLNAQVRGLYPQLAS
jgi:2-dehydropantoate 2-reductase